MLVVRKLTSDGGVTLSRVLKTFVETLCSFY
jgi:hypothetical protein